MNSPVLKDLSNLEDGDYFRIFATAFLLLRWQEMDYSEFPKKLLLITFLENFSTRRFGKNLLIKNSNLLQF